MPKRKPHDCAHELRTAGLRATPARKAILNLLETVQKPLEVSVILEHLKQKRIPADPATVFRIMNTFTEKSIAATVQLGDSVARYELSNRRHHHHLVCEDCGNVEDIDGCPLDDIEKTVQKKNRFFIKRHSLEFYGLCASCKK